MSENFAFGENKVDDCECPAVAAGCSLDNDLAIIAGEYDWKIEKKLEDSEFDAETYRNRRGIVDEENAKQCWLEVLEEIETDKSLEQAYEKGQKVAEDLGWLDE